jgi:hypothetical protein
LLGSFAVEHVDGEDVIVLKGTPTHVHVNWATITRLERTDRDGYDCIRFLGPADAVFELLAGDTEHKYSAELVSLVAPST